MCMCVYVRVSLYVSVSVCVSVRGQQIFFKTWFIDMDYYFDDYYHFHYSFICSILFHLVIYLFIHLVLFLSLSNLRNFTRQQENSIKIKKINNLCLPHQKNHTHR